VIAVGITISRVVFSIAVPFLFHHGGTEDTEKRPGEKIIIKSL